MGIQHFLKLAETKAEKEFRMNPRERKKIELMIIENWEQWEEYEAKEYEKGGYDEKRRV